MIDEKEKCVILDCAKRYLVSEVILFGSSIEDAGKPEDIDLAVKGVAKESFFKFYAELVKRLSKPVDLVDLSQESLFNKLVEETGVKIYG